MWRVLLCTAVCVLCITYSTRTVLYPIYPLFPFTRFAFALLNFLGSQHRIVPFKVLLCDGFVFVLGVPQYYFQRSGCYPFFVFDVLIKQQ